MGFKLKGPNKFEKRKGDSLYIYEISVAYTKSWFALIDHDAYLIKHTDYVALYLLKKLDDIEGLEAKYKEIYDRKKSLDQDTEELELFYKYLLQEH